MELVKVVADEENGVYVEFLEGGVGAGRLGGYLEKVREASLEMLRRKSG